MTSTIVVSLVLLSTWTVSAQRSFQGPIDEQRARQLYVSNKHEDHSFHDSQA